MSNSKSQLTEIRSFLARHQAAVPPWMSSDNAIDALYATLSTHRDNPRFWKDLKQLAMSLEGSIYTPASPLNCEVLRHATIDRLLEDLQRELQQAAPQGNLRNWLRTPVVVTALAGFLLLGCTTTDDTNSGPNQNTELTDEDLDKCDADNIQEEECANYHQLLNIVKEAQIYEAIIDDVLMCLPELDAEFRKEMLDAFENFNDDEIANYLAVLTTQGQVCFEDDDIGGH